MTRFQDIAFSIMIACVSFLMTFSISNFKHIKDLQKKVEALENPPVRPEISYHDYMMLNSEDKETFKQKKGLLK